MPNIIYGTAWKEDKTAALVKKAVLAGFKAIDTANQKKHYREDYVGDALKELFAKGIKREALFLQSKFTHVAGQDHRLPYDPKDEMSKQVQSSFASTLGHLHTDYLDSYLLHGPSSGYGMTDADWEVWKAMEVLYKSGKTKMIGVSNVGIAHLRELLEKASVKPAVVQNRCFARFGWDKSVRQLCQEHQIAYQGFSLLTANWQLLSDPSVGRLAQRLNATPQQVLFKFAMQVGMTPLTGTQDEMHMREDLKVSDLSELTAEEVALIEGIGL